MSHADAGDDVRGHRGFVLGEEQVQVGVKARGAVVSHGRRRPGSTG